jgi:hypothetical protein
MRRVLTIAVVLVLAASGCRGGKNSAMLLGELDATVTQFPDIDRAIYSFNGDVEAFYGWLQLAPPST